MYVGTGCHGKAQLAAVFKPKSIHVRFVGCVIYFNSVTGCRCELDIRKVIPLSERMSLDHETACLVNCFKEFMSCHLHDALIIKEPFFIDSVKKIFVFPEVIFDTEHYFKISALRCLQCTLIAGAVHLNPFLPGKIFRNACVAVKEVIRNDYSVVTLLKHVRDIILTMNLTACTCLTCVKMCLI